MFRLFSLFILLSFSLSAETVYCIHGFMRKPESMHKMARSFRKLDYSVENWGYPSREQTIEEHGKALVLALKQTAKSSPGDPIHFVTHSMGGVILRVALNDPECPEEAKQGRAVLLAPPNGGSAFGRYLNRFSLMQKWLGPNAGQQLLTKECFHHLGSFPKSVDALVIAGTFGMNPLIEGKNDGKVAVTETCLETPHLHYKIFVGHARIMYHPEVIHAANLFIVYGPEYNS